MASCCVSQFLFLRSQGPSKHPWKKQVTECQLPLLFSFLLDFGCLSLGCFISSPMTFNRCYLYLPIFSNSSQQKHLSATIYSIIVGHRTTKLFLMPKQLHIAWIMVGTKWYSFFLLLWFLITWNNFYMCSDYFFLQFICWHPLPIFY